MSSKDRYPILEFDPARRAVIEPSEHLKPGVLPRHAVLCFFQEVIRKVAKEHGARIASVQKSEVGRHPVYRIRFRGRPVAFMHPGVGAPLAAGLLEEMIALGVRRCVACGGAGVLDSGIAVGRVVVPVSAVRDEGMSYHYMKPGREVAPDPRAVAGIRRVLTRHRVPFIEGKTWTTDGVYRETRGKVKRRRAEGCLTVEMEAAAFFAVARFRGIRFGQLLYGGDDVSSEKWDSRRWDTRASVREKLFWLAVESVLEMP